MTEQREIMTRTQAIERGLRRYFTGKPCKRGHVVERITKCAHCIECAREHARKKSRLYHKKHRAKLLPEMRARAAKYRKENPEKVAESKAKEYKRNKSRYVAAANARRRNTQQDVEKLTNEEKQQRISIYSLRDVFNEVTEHRPGEPLYVEVEHIIPISQAERFCINPEHPNNLHLAYRKDNGAKSNNIPI